MEEEIRMKVKRVSSEGNVDVENRLIFTSAKLVEERSN